MYKISIDIVDDAMPLLKCLRLWAVDIRARERESIFDFMKFIFVAFLVLSTVIGYLANLLSNSLNVIW